MSRIFVSPIFRNCTGRSSEAGIMGTRQGPQIDWEIVDMRQLAAPPPAGLPELHIRRTPLPPVEVPNPHSRERSIA
jgi:hypothetical protein